MLALLERERTGEGQWVHTSLLEAQIFMLDFQAARYLIEGRGRRAGGQRPSDLRPTGVFPTADGYINIAASGDSLWERFCEAIGAPELLTASGVSPPASCARRTARRSTSASPSITEGKPSAHWVETLNEAGVPCGPINTIDKVFADPQVQHLGIAHAGRPPEARRIKRRRPADPPDRSAAARIAHTPEPGEHTDEILASLGYDAKAIAGLRSRGVI